MWTWIWQVFNQPFENIRMIAKKFYFDYCLYRYFEVTKTYFKIAWDFSKLITAKDKFQIYVDHNDVNQRCDAFCYKGSRLFLKRNFQTLINLSSYMRWANKIYKYADAITYFILHLLDFRLNTFSELILPISSKLYTSSPLVTLPGNITRVYSFKNLDLLLSFKKNTQQK